MSLDRALYRSRQVQHALRPRIDPIDLAFARSLLTDRERDLFDAMERRDQRHAIAVLTKVRVHTEDHDVLIAALLHDCGKGAVPAWLRILKVMSPATLLHLAHPHESKGWRHAAHRLHHHESIGERLAREAGVSEGAIRLIAGYPEPHELWKAAILEDADNNS
jgi:hypothetical protein